MNLTPLLSALALAQSPAPTPAQAPTAASLISKMFARYAGARSFSGTIRTTQSARGASVTTNTVVAYERPAKIHIEQAQAGRETHRSSTVVSDGKLWVWSKPEGLYGQAKYLSEPVVREGRPDLGIGDIYAVSGATLPDRSTALDLVVARPDDLRRFRDALISFAYQGNATIGGRAVHRIVGTARDDQATGTGNDFSTSLLALANHAAGSDHGADSNNGLSTTHQIKDIELDLTDDGDIVRYVATQKFAVPTTDPKTGRTLMSNDMVVVTTTWDVTGAVGAALSPDAFKMPKG